MKKLMIVMAAIALAGVTQAASFQWKTSTGQYVYQAGTSTKASGTAYLFNSATVSQTALLTAILTEGKSITELTSLSSKALSSAGAVAATSFSWGDAGDSLTAYFAIVDGDNVFISGTQTGTALETGTTQLQFGSISAPSKLAATQFSGTVSGAGWYTSVPEPTSGLLMLVGLCALALRRRRA